MSEITVDLSQHKFGGGIKVFKDAEVKFENKNFIFAKNGSGKSTLAEIIMEQFSLLHDVRIYQGFDVLLGENEHLDAFALAVNATENEKEIRKLEQKIKEKEDILKEIESSLEKPDNETKNLYTKLEKIKSEEKKKRDEIEKICTDSAKKINDMDNPKISIPRYDKRHFKPEINKASLLQDVEVAKLKEILNSDTKVANKLHWANIEFDKYLKSVNEILDSEVKEKTKIVRLSNNQEKRSFAEEGLRIHKNKSGEICAFCGNEISVETFSELERYFSADEVKNLRKQIANGLKVIDEKIDKIDIVAIDYKNFYSTFQDEAKECYRMVDIQKNKILDFFNQIKEALEDKQKNLFDKAKQLELDVPKNLEIDAINETVDKNNDFGKNLEKEKQNAKDKLRYHYIKVALNEFDYDSKKALLEKEGELREEAQKVFDSEFERQAPIQGEIDKLKGEIDALKPKAEKQAVEHINRKLKLSVPWQVDFAQGEDSGYYRIIQKDEEGNSTYRGVKELSTGEKNIIAFLYFIEKLEELGQKKGLHKIIVFDDPMNSNDATMQYLIITELQKLYRGNEKKKYDPEKDFLLIMTHNIHFYLNVQPQGNFKDKKLDKNKPGKSIEVTKYDKNKFFHLNSGKFDLIKSVKEDFKTSYEALWVELRGLADSNLRNSMLNSMRRIIETYMGFTGVNQDTFYQGNEQYLKLFNVNSHAAVDSLSAESFTESTEDLKNLFEQIFVDNGAEEHFNCYWRN